MPNQSGSVYGLTILSPIIQDDRTQLSANLSIRLYLAGLDRRQQSPFAKVSGTHLARLVVMDDVVYVGMPACEEHLMAQYLVFESNFDGDLDTYLERLAKDAAEEINAVWKHCTGYPGTQDLAAFKAYMKACQVDTTFFFADVNNKTVQQTLIALRTQKAVEDFMDVNQGQPAEQIQKAFAALVRRLRALPAPLPGLPAEQHHLSRHAAQSHE